MPAGVVVKAEEVPSMPEDAAVKKEEVPSMPNGTVVKKEKVKKEKQQVGTAPAESDREAAIQKYLKEVEENEAVAAAAGMKDYRGSSAVGPGEKPTLNKALLRNGLIYDAIAERNPEGTQSFAPGEIKLAMLGSAGSGKYSVNVTTNDKYKFYGHGEWRIEMKKARDNVSPTGDARILRATVERDNGEVNSLFAAAPGKFCVAHGKAIDAKANDLVFCQVMDGWRCNEWLETLYRLRA